MVELMTDAHPPAVDRNVGLPRLLVVGTCPVELWAMDSEERLRRTFRLADVAPVPNAEHGSDPEELRDGLIVVGAQWVLDVGLVRGLVQRPGVLLMAAGAEGGPQRVVLAHLAAGSSREQLLRVTDLIGHNAAEVAAMADLGLEIVDPASIGSAYNNALRKRELPYVASLLETPLDEVERRTFGASYKGVTDFVTKWLWPRPARTVTRWAAERRITPNAVTAASLVLVLVALGLFAEGLFFAGLVAGWVMTFLDTVDGKLARVTHSSSKWGNVFDHGIDLIHPPFWWAAWWWGLGGAAAGAPLEAAMWIIVVGYVAGRLIEGAFLQAFAIEIHIWRRIDSLVRQVTARRNPNLALLSIAVIFGEPGLGFYAVAAWTLISLAFHLARLGQAFISRRSGRGVDSWLAEPVEDTGSSALGEAELSQSPDLR